MNGIHDGEGVCTLVNVGFEVCVDAVFEGGVERSRRTLTECVVCSNNCGKGVCIICVRGVRMRCVKVG